MAASISNKLLQINKLTFRRLSGLRSSYNCTDYGKNQHKSYKSSSILILPRCFNNENKSSGRSYFGFGLALTSLVGSCVWWCYISKKKENFSISSLDYIRNVILKLLPVVNAAKPFDADLNEVKPKGKSDYNSGDVKNPPSQRFNFIADVVDKTSPAVVYLEIKGRHPYHGGQVTLSNGSGFIISEDGLIVTNAHVVASGNSVTVKLQDGRTFLGVLESIDNVADLATIRIKCNKLPTLLLGDSNKLRPGEWVVAMGSPLSLSNTITSGIISAINRESKELGLQKDMDYIQTDAAINFGNSGGPLLNLDGQVIGINTMKVTAGISFAIPINYVKQFLEKSEDYNSGQSSWFGKKKKRYMGITMLTLTPRIINEMRMLKHDFPSVSNGVLVWKIIDSSPAFLAGICPGDVITHINEQQIISSSDVYKVLEKSDGSLKFTILRNNKIVNIDLLPIDV